MNAKAGYRVNEDGSVTRIDVGNSDGNNSPKNNSSGNGGCLWGVIIAVLIIVAVFYLKNSSSNSPKNDSTDSVEVVEVTEEIVSPVYDTIATVNTFPKTSLSDGCTLKRMDDTYSGWMLVPNFLSNHRIDEDGWMVYSSNNGSYLTSVILDYDGSAYQFISQLSNGLNSTYSTHKANWAVDSGLYGNQIYYMKAVKSGDRIYCAAFFVLRGDKPNAKLYTRLTERIFNSSNFPIW